MRPRGSSYLDRRTASNVVKIGHELREIAERLNLFEFEAEAIRMAILAEQLVKLGIDLGTKLGDQRLFKDSKDVDPAVVTKGSGERSGSPPRRDRTSPICPVPVRERGDEP